MTEQKVTPEIPPEFTPALLNRLYKLSERLCYPEGQRALEAEVLAAHQARYISRHDGLVGD